MATRADQLAAVALDGGGMVVLEADLDQMLAGGVVIVAAGDGALVAVVEALAVAVVGATVVHVVPAAVVRGAAALVDADETRTLLEAVSYLAVGADQVVLSAGIVVFVAAGHHLVCRRPLHLQQRDDGALDVGHPQRFVVVERQGLHAAVGCKRHDRRGTHELLLCVAVLGGTGAICCAVKEVRRRQGDDGGQARTAGLAQRTAGIGVLVAVAAEHVVVVVVVLNNTTVQVVRRDGDLGCKLDARVVRGTMSSLRVRGRVVTVGVAVARLQRQVVRC